MNRRLMLVALITTGGIVSVGCSGADRTYVQVQRRAGQVPGSAAAGQQSERRVTQETAALASPDLLRSDAGGPAAEQAVGEEDPFAPSWAPDAAPPKPSAGDAGSPMDAHLGRLCDAVAAPTCERLGANPPLRDATLRALGVSVLAELQLSCELAALTPAPGLPTLGFLNDFLDLVRALMECSEAPLDAPTLYDWVRHVTAPLPPDPEQIQLLIELVVGTLAEPLSLSDCEGDVLRGRLQAQVPLAPDGPWGNWSRCKGP